VKGATGLALAVVAGLAVAGVFVLSGGSSRDTGHASLASPRTPMSGGRVAAHFAALVRGISLRQLAGQRIIYAYSGFVPPRSLLTRIRDGEAAGVILFAPNISSRAQVRAAARELQDAARTSVVHEPLLIMTDQEGGLVRRLTGAPDLSEKQIGASPDGRRLAASSGVSAGRNLRDVSANVNLAPVLDVFRQTGDFIDRFQRSYGTSADLVASLGGAFIAAQQSAGVAATAKHFPGLGAASASQDSDEAPVTLSLSLGDLRAVDERPYRTAIADGVRMIMTSWATYPSLDPARPAGLSSLVIGRELRGRLGFRGVTITDALGAGALRRYGGFAARGALAARAGQDLLVCAMPNAAENTPANGVAALNGITAALNANTVSRKETEQAAMRVLALRANP